MHRIKASMAKKFMLINNRHLASSLTCVTNNTELRPKTAINPIKTKSCPKIPKIPRLLAYFGNNYLIYKGVSARRIPMVMPCKHLRTKNASIC
jgi:hypothetical protein